MFLTVHAAVGAVIGQQVGSSLLAFLAGFISHFILDFIPHGDNHMIVDYRNGHKVKRIIFIILADLIGATVLTLGILYLNLSSPSLPFIFWGVIGAIIPDFLVGLYQLYEFRILKKFYAVHTAIHTTLEKYDIKFIHGITIQAIFL
ncbi:MAG TPA: hypothetical protein VGA49_00270, partial [Patescibacteria group bacterium]